MRLNNGERLPSVSGPTGGGGSLTEVDAIGWTARDRAMSVTCTPIGVQPKN